MRVEAISKITDDVFDGVRRLVPFLGAHKPIPTREELTALVTSEAATLFLAREDGQIVGMLSITVYRVPTGIRSIIEDVVVDEAFRQRGIAKALMERAIRHAKEQGASNVSLTSNPQRVEANLLYQNMGFARRETNAYFYKLK